MKDGAVTLSLSVVSEENNFVYTRLRAIRNPKEPRKKKENQHTVFPGGEVGVGRGAGGGENREAVGKREQNVKHINTSFI